MSWKKGTDAEIEMEMEMGVDFEAQANSIKIKLPEVEEWGFRDTFKGTKIDTPAGLGPAGTMYEDPEWHYRFGMRTPRDFRSMKGRWAPEDEEHGEEERDPNEFALGKELRKLRDALRTADLDREQLDELCTALRLIEMGSMLGPEASFARAFYATRVYIDEVDVTRIFQRLLPHGNLALNLESLVRTIWAREAEGNRSRKSNKVSALDLDREGYVIASSINATVLRMKPSHSDETKGSKGTPRGIITDTITGIITAVWEVDKNKIRLKIPASNAQGNEHGDKVTSLALTRSFAAPSRGESLAVTGSLDGKLRVFDLRPLADISIRGLSYPEKEAFALLSKHLHRDVLVLLSHSLEERKVAAMHRIITNNEEQDNPRRGLPKKKTSSGGDGKPHDFGDKILVLFLEGGAFATKDGHHLKRFGEGESAGGWGWARQSKPDEDGQTSVLSAVASPPMSRGYSAQSPKPGSLSSMLSRKTSAKKKGEPPWVDPQVLHKAVLDAIEDTDPTQLLRFFLTDGIDAGGWEALSADEKKQQLTKITEPDDRALLWKDKVASAPSRVTSLFNKVRIIGRLSSVARAGKDVDGPPLAVPRPPRVSSWGSGSSKDSGGIKPMIKKGKQGPPKASQRRTSDREEVEKPDWIPSLQVKVACRMYALHVRMPGRWRILGHLAGHEAGVTSLVVDGLGNAFSGSRDRSVRLWDLKGFESSAESSGVWKGSSSRPNSAAGGIGGAGQTPLSSPTKREGSPVKHDAKSDDGDRVVFSSGGEIGISAGQEGKLMFWRLRPGHPQPFEAGANGSNGENGMNGSSGWWGRGAVGECLRVVEYKGGRGVRAVSVAWRISEKDSPFYRERRVGAGAEMVVVAAGDCGEMHAFRAQVFSLCTRR
ncbi:hypothetical protein T484DRAFT_1788793 [Baffinella frigidus]|nr:hypothetical protein T484DRAFT_1788793 [Cryptophyta sp. CCMP2293]